MNSKRDSFKFSTENESWKTVTGIFLIVAGAFLFLGEAAAETWGGYMIIFWGLIIVGIYLLHKGSAEEKKFKVAEKQ